MVTLRVNKIISFKLQSVYSIYLLSPSVYCVVPFNKKFSVLSFTQSVSPFLFSFLFLTVVFYSGNVVIETSFYDGNDEISRSKVRIYYV